LLPEATVYLTWIEGKQNSADAASKLFCKNIDIINSTMYREGPPDFKTGNGMDNQVVFYKFSKEGEKCIPLPQRLIMRARKDSNEILEKDMENMRCKKCSVDEDCGIYLTRQIYLTTKWSTSVQLILYELDLRLTTCRTQQAHYKELIG
jgi:hypothetical protein